MITVNLYYKGTNGNARAFAELRDKYDLHMSVERFVSDEYKSDEKYLRK
jgi:hypothetical protein